MEGGHDIMLWLQCMQLVERRAALAGVDGGANRELEIVFAEIEALDVFNTSRWSRNSQT